jgi:hypothetical protein
VAVLLLLGLLVASVAATPFLAPENFTQGEGGGARTQLTRNPQGSLLWLGPERLVLGYFDGYEDGTSTMTPGRIWLRPWSLAGGWGARQHIDHSLTPAGQPIGGRQPALIRRTDGAVQIAWHDMRHCTAPRNWIDNTEIYGNTWTTDTVSTADTRLTLSASGSIGDNGYNPRLARLPDGRLLLAWYDYTWDANISEIALRLSDAQGNFGTPPPMVDTRLTTSGTRLSGDESQEFTLPSVAVAANGLVHLCWILGHSAAPTRIYHAVYDPTAGKLLRVQLAATGASGYYDPPRLVADPTTDSVYLLYHDASGGPARVRRVRNSGTQLDAPVQLTPTGTAVGYPDAAIDTAGHLQVVYVNTTAAQVELRLYDPQTQTTAAALNLSAGATGDWLRPTITLDPQGVRYVVWEQQDVMDSALGDLWFTTDHPPRNAARGWTCYE